MLNLIDGFVTQHPYLAMALLMLASNAIAAMPAPTSESGAAYKWLFGFAHSINIPRLLATFNPALAGRMGMMPNGNGEDKANSAGAGK